MCVRACVCVCVSAVIATPIGPDRLYASLQWRHGYRDNHAPRVPNNTVLNNVARVHYTHTPPGGGKPIDRIMNVVMPNQTSVMNRGWSRLYATPTIGNYTIAMNLYPESLSWTPPPALVGRAVVDLVSGKTFDSLPDSVPIDPNTGMVLCV